MTARSLRRAGRAFALPAVFAAGALLSLALSGPANPHEQRGATPRQSDRFSNIVLTNQHGTAMRFYDDVVKDRTVVINLMYTGCGDVCPANSAQLALVNRILGERMGRDIEMVSISIDPVADSSARLKQYWAAFGSLRGWLFLTGDAGEIDALRRELGAYDLDPALDADPTQHAGYVMVGNDAADRWLVLPLLMSVDQLVAAIVDIAATRRAKG